VQKRMTSESDLLQRARLFDESALAELYDRYSPGLYRYAVRQLGEPDMAEECVSESFSRLLGAFSRGKGPDQHLQAYLYRIAHNWITDLFRREPAEPLPLEAEQLTADSPDPDDLVSDQEDYQALRAAIAELTPDQRQVFVLKYWEDWTNEAIAQALHKPVGAVKSLQHRAIQRLKRRMLKEDTE
jgi:RNA polymerase sigma-70 factor, ECF subfamily